MLLAFVIGVFAGWMSSIPVAGPISALVVARGIQGRYRAATMIAVGGALGEAAYAFLAFWGFVTFLVDYPIIIPISQAVGAVVVLSLGIAFVRKPTTKEAPTYAPRDSPWSNFALGLWLAVINPALLATWGGFITAIHGSGIIDLSDAMLAVPMAIGCGIGIGGWFVILAMLIKKHREKFRPETLARFIRGMGVFLLVISGWFVYKLVTYFL